jgi:hypothetical protein
MVFFTLTVFLLTILVDGQALCLNTGSEWARMACMFLSESLPDSVSLQECKALQEIEKKLSDP